MDGGKMMKGAKYSCVNGRSSADICQVPKPEIQKEDEVLIRVEAVSICGTDVRALSNPPVFEFVEGVIIGHECCGIVEAVGGQVTNCKVGDKVVVHPNIWCGKCDACRTGHINLCENFRHIGDRIDGCMADYLCIEERMVYPISRETPSWLASLAEPLACVLNGTTTVKAHPGDQVIVLGGGPIGLLFAMLYKAAGAVVGVSEPSEYRRNLALSLGVDYVVNPKEQDLETEVRAKSVYGADIVVDAVGVLLPDALQITRKGAHIVVFGVNQAAKVQLNQYPITEKELTIHGTYITKGTFPKAVRIIENNLIPLDKLVTHRLKLEELNRGVELMLKGQAGKIVIEI